MMKILFIKMNQNLPKIKEFCRRGCELFAENETIYRIIIND